MTLAGAAPVASADQSKGQAKQAQQQDAKEKNKNKNKDKDKDKARPDDDRRSDQGRDDTQMRFAGMDRDRNGVITRAEWSGNEISFANQDWDGNGVLSGDEVRPGATKPTGGPTAPTRFHRWDVNRDNVIARAEWQGTTEAFNRLDMNRDGVLSGNELPAVPR